VPKEMQGYLFSGPEVRRLLVSDREPAAEVA
jgi:hypothetical protein